MKEATATISGRVVSPKEFVRVYREQKGSILQTEIRPARLGENGFGKIVIHTRAGNRLEVEHIRSRK